MASFNSVAYCSGALGPGNIASNVADIQQSGLTTVVLWALHIGRPDIKGQQYGDLIFNDTGTTIVSAGTFNPLGIDAIGAWPAQVAALKQGSSVSKIFLSVGGANPPVWDFTTIQTMLKNGQADILQQNFQTLRTAFTFNGVCVIDGIDLDCEEYVDESTIVQFCQILFGLGFEVTFCPYTNQQFWQDCMQTLWNQNLKVSWWNLQCYAGGGGNGSNLPSWITTLAAVVGNSAAPSYLVPGLAVQGSEGDGMCPTGSNSICTTFAGWSSFGLPGGFMWMYDSIRANPGLCNGTSTLSNYVTAINNGLSNNC